jgi:hypothetical protein
MKRLTMPLIVISIFLLLSLTVSAWTIYNIPPTNEATLFNITHRTINKEANFNESRSAPRVINILNTGYYGYIGQFMNAVNGVYIYRIFQNYNLDTIPNNSYVDKAQLKIVVLGQTALQGIAMLEGNQTDTIVKEDWDSFKTADIRHSSAIGTYKIGSLLGVYESNLSYPAWTVFNLSFNYNGTDWLNSIFPNATKQRKIVLISGADKNDTRNKTTTNLLRTYTIRYPTRPPYLFLNVTLNANGTYPLFYGHNLTNFSIIQRTGQKVQFNITPHVVIGNDNTNKYTLNYSSYKNGVGYYYGSTGWTAWNNDVNIKIPLKINYSDGGWFYYSWNFTSIKGKSIRISHNYTDLHYQPSYFYLLGNWSNLTSAISPNKYYNFTSTLRTDGYPHICKYWYEAGIIKNNISFPCNAGTNTTIKNQTKFLLTNFSLAGWYHWKFWANTTTGVSNASKWSNVSGYSFTFVDNCTIVKNKTMNIYFYDEDFPTHKLNVTLELTLNTTDPFGFPVRYANKMTGKNNYSLCFNPNFTGAYTDVYMKYFSEESAPNLYYNRFYYFNKSLNATVTNLILYALNTTSGLSVLKITARHESDYSLWTGLIGLLQRQYVAEGVWRTVQAFQSDQFGQLLYYVREANQDYRIIYYDKYNNRYNNVLYQTPSMVFICTSGLCSYSELITPYVYSTSGRDIGLTYSLNNITNILTVNWNDPESLTTSVNMQVLKYGAGGTNYICNQTQVGASGTMTCDVSLYDGAIFLSVYSTGSPIRWDYSAWIEIIKNIHLANLFPEGTRESAFWGFLIGSVIIGAGMVAGILGAVLFSVVGLIVAYYSHLVSYLTYSMIVGAVIIALLIGVKLKR